MLKSALRSAFCRLIDGYQFILSPFIGNQCRFHPTCSVYMRQAVMRHGILKGIILGTRRISCCQPYYKGNYQDLVPETFEWKELIRYKQSTSDKCQDHACDNTRQKQKDAVNEAPESCNKVKIKQSRVD
jgi:putative membrane protein insertion efficiency factor